MTTLNLPEPIAAYFDADRRGDAGAVARCFAKEGVVQDDGHTYSGAAAIEKWKSAVSAKLSYTSQPIALEQTNGRHVVTSTVTGNFPGSPLDLRYAFKLERGKIASLEIRA
jgi:hypothetical protein